MVSHLPFTVKGQAPFAFPVLPEHPLLPAWAHWTLHQELVASQPGSWKDGSVTYCSASGQCVCTLPATWGQKHLSTSHRAPTLSAAKGGFSIRSWQRLYLGKCESCPCCDLSFPAIPQCKDWLLYCKCQKAPQGSRADTTQKTSSPHNPKVKQNGLLHRHSEVLLSPVCCRETEAWQAWVTSTRSYMPVGVLGIKPRSFWHIETQAYISYRLGRLRVLSSPPLTVCATETAFVLRNLLPNVSHITSAVNCKTHAPSLWSTCPASLWLFLLAARLDFLWSWLFANFCTFDPRINQSGELVLTFLVVRDLLVTNTDEEDIRFPFVSPKISNSDFNYNFYPLLT